MNDDPVLKNAFAGDINAFQKLWAEFQPQLKSYLYRLVADRSDADDLAHDCFVKSFDRITSFRAESSLKTWCFQIATHLAYDFLKDKKRWLPDAQDRARAFALGDHRVYDAINRVSAASGEGAYDMREHIDFCFTCVSKTLPIEQQIALLLKEVYDFSLKDIMLVLGQTEGVTKHLLLNSRRTMTEIFDHRCALVNKNGACNQCSELNGIHNPKQNQQAALMKLELRRGTAKKYDRDALFQIRAELIRGIDPLRGRGADLQDVLMQCTRAAIGELENEF